MDSRLTNFVAFLRDIGATFDDQCIQFSHSKLQGYGVIALKDIQPGQLLAKIPKTAILSVETASLWQHVNNQHRRQLLEQHDGMISDDDIHPRDQLCPPMFQLAAAVLFETLLGAKSRWFRYLNILPRSLAEIGLPLAEPEDEVSRVCKGTGIDILTGNVRSALCSVFNGYVKKLFINRGKQLGISEERINSIPLEQFAVAFSWVTSRAFLVDSYHGNSMVPIADMFNHRTDGEHIHVEGADDDDSIATSDDECEDESITSNEDDDNAEPLRNDTINSPAQGDDELISRKGDRPASKPEQDGKSSDDQLRIVAIKNVADGDEVFNTFGHKSNTILYLNYGFTEPENGHDTAFVHRDLIESVLKEFQENNRDIHRKMTPERRRMIGEAEPVIDDAVNDNFFQIASDGSFCQGFMVLLYLNVTPWSKLSQFQDDNLELLNHVMQLSVSDVLASEPKYVVQVISNIINKQLMQFPVGTTLESDKASLTESKHMPSLERHMRRIRIGQRRALLNASEKFLALAKSTGNPIVNDLGERNISTCTEPQAKRARKETSLT